MKKQAFTLRRLLALMAALAILLSAFAGCSKPKVPDDSTGNSIENSTGSSIENSTENSTGNANEDPTEESTGNSGEDPTEESTGNSNEDPTEGTDNQPQVVTVKNVIFMIADGGGYDNYTLADKVKEEMVKRGVNHLEGAKTQITTDLLQELGIASTTGLYLDQFLVGSANTLLLNPYGDAKSQSSYITDSAAAGTALSSGYKTVYCHTGVDADGTPRASITELARMNGMATGLVTNKSYMDATPQTFFTSHAIHRYEYQDNSLQSLLSGIDVVIGEGTEFGDMYARKPSSHPDISASTMGYTVARNKTEMLNAAKTATKLWAAILGVNNDTNSVKKSDLDRAKDHISYDIDADVSAEQPSLLEMTQAALQVLGTNINDPDGFFLMIEGGALDNAAEPGSLRAAVGEYLAFDEAFGYCVSWAAQRGDTIVIAVPDHDSGGFSGIEACEKELINSIITGMIGEKKFTSKTEFSSIKNYLSKIGADASKMSLKTGHTEMAVPISLYAPKEETRTALLTEMGLPTVTGNVRLGTNEYYVPSDSNKLTWYTSSALNNDYTIDNTKIAPAIAKVLEMGDLDEATKQLFVRVGHTDGTTFESSYGGEVVFGETLFENKDAQFYYNTYTNTNKGLSVDRNMPYYMLNGKKVENTKIGNQLPIAIFVLDERLKPTAGTFYVPKNIADLLKDAG